MIYDLWITFLIKFESAMFRGYTDLTNPRSNEFFREKMRQIEGFSTFMITVFIVYFIVFCLFEARCRR